ncbi:hypothetical protein AB0911_36080 [Streptomyces nigra]|uniref:hypothetical protein n=1 Tax=Streptomyces nigra TaxID=1827580 RepID=UPI0034521880
MFTAQQEELIKALLDKYGLYNRFRKRDLQELAGGRNIDQDFAVLMRSAFKATIGSPAGYVLDYRMVVYKPEILQSYGRGRIRSTPDEMAYEECNIVPNVSEDLLYRSMRQDNEWLENLWDRMVHDYLYSARQAALILPETAEGIFMKRRALERVVAERFRKHFLHPAPAEDIIYESLKSEIHAGAYLYAEFLAERAQGFANAVHYYGSIEDAREARQRTSARRYDPIKSPRYVLPSPQHTHVATASAASAPLPTSGSDRGTSSRRTQTARPHSITPHALPDGRRRML